MSKLTRRSLLAAAPAAAVVPVPAAMPAIATSGADPVVELCATYRKALDAEHEAGNAYMPFRASALLQMTDDERSALHRGGGLCEDAESAALSALEAAQMESESALATVLSTPSTSYDGVLAKVALSEGYHRGASNAGVLTNAIADLIRLQGRA